MSIELVMPSNHLVLCCPLLLPPSIFPSIRIFSNELALHVRGPKYWSFSFSISPSSEYPTIEGGIEKLVHCDHMLQNALWKICRSDFSCTSDHSGLSPLLRLRSQSRPYRDHAWTLDFKNCILSVRKGMGFRSDILDSEKG